MTISSSFEGDLWITNVHLVDVVEGCVEPNTRVHVLGGVIQQIGGRGQLDKSTMIDGQGCYLLPGLTDAHVHLALDGSADALDNYMRANSRQRFLSALSSLDRHLMAGVTTVRDMACPDQVAIALKQTVLAAPSFYPRALLSGAALTTIEGHGHYFGREISNREQLITAVQEQATRFDFAKVMGSGGNLTETTNPSDLQFSQEQLELMVRTAKLFGRRIAIHMHPAEGISAAIAARVGSIEHGSYASDSHLQSMADMGIAFVPTLAPAIFLFHTLESQGLSYQDKVERVEARRQAAARSRVWGTQVLAGTDGGVPYTPHGAVVQELIELHRLGFSPLEALRTATLLPGIAWGYANRLGLIKPGAFGDMILVENNPLEELSSLSNVLLVLKSGRIVVNRMA